MGTATGAAEVAGARAAVRAERLGRRRRADLPAEVTLAVAITIWAVTFSVLVYLKHARFASVDFDMGIHDQSVWLLAHFRGFLTVRGLQVFGHHATPGYVLFVPFYWLGGGPHLLNITQVCVAALGAVPVYLLARYRTGKAWLGTALGVAFLLHPALQFFMSELFHPEVIAITPLLCAYYCSVRKRWGWFALFAILAACWKEDVALAVAVLGLVIALRGDRKVGLVTAGIALAWFSAWVFAVFPILDHGRIQNEALYADVGGSPGGILRTAFTHPGRITSKLATRDSLDYGWKLLAPYGLTALLAPLALLLGAPQALLNLITNVPWTKTITFHYAAIPFAAVTIASVEGVSFLARKLRAYDGAAIVGAVVLVCALMATVAWGPSPIGDEYRDGEWALTADSTLAAARAAVDRVPGSAAVSATYNMVPHLTHRAEIYTFPNPWQSSNFGIDGRPRRSGRRVQWIVADRNVLDRNTRALLVRLTTTGPFRVVYARDQYVVARRVR
ncbi:MAG TPA: DUF2079 domain-containing protein [Acidimicrobiia bacterium]|nr:DUF2079 domain-containing protein [Acidimicrobiia bacterium]